jgi:hypothetical protein
MKAASTADKPMMQYQLSQLLEHYAAALKTLKGLR